MGEATLFLEPRRELCAVPAICRPSAPLSVVHSQGKGSQPSLCPGSAKWVLVTATGMFLLPWVLQGALDSSWRELASRSGGELPVTRGMHLKLGNTLGHGTRQFLP